MAHTAAQTAILQAACDYIATHYPGTNPWRLANSCRNLGVFLSRFAKLLGFPTQTAFVARLLGHY